MISVISSPQAGLDAMAVRPAARALQRPFRAAIIRKYMFLFRRKLEAECIGPIESIPNFRRRFVRVDASRSWANELGSPSRPTCTVGGRSRLLIFQAEHIGVG